MVTIKMVYHKFSKKGFLNFQLTAFYFFLRILSKILKIKKTFKLLISKTANFLWFSKSSNQFQYFWASVARCVKHWFSVRSQVQYPGCEHSKACVCCLHSMTSSMGLWMATAPTMFWKPWLCHLTVLMHTTSSCDCIGYALICHIPGTSNLQVVCM